MEEEKIIFANQQLSWAKPKKGSLQRECVQGEGDAGRHTARLTGLRLEKYLKNDSEKKPKTTGALPRDQHVPRLGNQISGGREETIKQTVGREKVRTRTGAKSAVGRTEVTVGRTEKGFSNDKPRGGTRSRSRQRGHVKPHSRQ